MLPAKMAVVQPTQYRSAYACVKPGPIAINYRAEIRPVAAKPERACSDRITPVSPDIYVNLIDSYTDSARLLRRCSGKPSKAAKSDIKKQLLQIVNVYNMPKLTTKLSVIFTLKTGHSSTN
jgi:hypothetical protein